jgi:uncharacterized protein
MATAGRTDPLTPGRGRIDALIVKLAARCNLNCSYCYVYNGADRGFLDRPRFVSDAVFDRTLAAVREYCDRRGRYGMTLIFHGGEPTLIGARRFGELAARAERELGPRLSGLSIQTNATRIDDAWVEVFRRHRVHVGVSLDGPAEVHDAVRVDHQGRGSHAATVAGLARLQEGGVETSVLSVVQPGRAGGPVYAYFRSLGIRQLDFLFPDVSHDDKERLFGGWGQTPVSDFLIPIFDAWFDEDDPDVQVRLFWSLLRMLLGGSGETDHFGNPLMGYLIVETDGAIEALDALRVCEDGIAKSGLNVLHHGFDDLHLALPLVHRAVHEGLPLPTACRACPERRLCGGGYLPHRYSRAQGFDNPSVWCADIRALLGHMRGRIGNAAVA